MEEKKENSSQNSDPSSKSPESKTMFFDSEKKFQMISILLGLGTIFSAILAPITIVSYSKAINAPFLLPIMMSTISYNMVLFFLGLTIIIVLLPVFLGIFAATIFEEKRKAIICASFFGILLAPAYYNLFHFFLGFIKLNIFLYFIILLLLLLPVIAVLTSIVWLSFFNKKESSGENQSCPFTKNPNKKKIPSPTLVVPVIFLILLTAAQLFFANGFFRWMGYGDLVVEIVEIDSEGKMKDTVKGCLLFNSGKEIYVQLNSPVQPNSSQPNSSCSSQGQPSEWVMIRFADKLGVDDFSQKAPGSIIRIPYKKIISFGPDQQSSKTAMSPQK